MNPYLHGTGIGGDQTRVRVDDSLRSHPGVNFGLVLTHPPFGRKSSLTFSKLQGRVGAGDPDVGASRPLGHHQQHSARLPATRPRGAEEYRPDGPHAETEDTDGEAFQGADFQFLAANVVDDRTGGTVFPPYGVRNFKGIKVAFIGLTLEGTPNIVARSGVAGLSFLDEAETVNALVPQLREEGIEAIVVLLHQGAPPTAARTTAGPAWRARSRRSLRGWIQRWTLWLPAIPTTSKSVRSTASGSQWQTA